MMQVEPCDEPQEPIIKVPTVGHMKVGPFKEVSLKDVEVEAEDLRHLAFEYIRSIKHPLNDKIRSWPEKDTARKEIAKFIEWLEDKE